MSLKKSPWTPLAVAAVTWGLAVVLARAVLTRDVDTMTLLSIRMALAMVALIPIVVATSWLRVRSRQAWIRGSILGVANMALPQVFLTRALEDLPASLGGLLLALMPLATVLAAHFVVPGERFLARSVPGLLLALTGSAILVGIGGESIDGVDNLWRGVAFSLVGVVLGGFGGALTRRYAMDVPGEQLVLPQFITSTVVLVFVLPLVFTVDFGAVDRSSFGLLVLLGTVGTALPFVAFILAAKVNPTWRLGLIAYAVPVVAVVLAIVFLDEQLTLPMLVGAVIVIAGVFVTDRVSSRTPAFTGDGRPAPPG